MRLWGFGNDKLFDQLSAQITPILVQTGDENGSHLLTGALRVLLGNGCSTAFIGRRSRCWGHVDNGTNIGAWISLGIQMSKLQHKLTSKPPVIIQKNTTLWKTKWNARM